MLLSQHSIILSKLSMRKYGVILDMGCNKLTFWPGHYQHSKVKNCRSWLSKKLMPTQKPLAEPQTEPHAEPYIKPHIIATQHAMNMSPKYIVLAKQIKVLKAVLEVFLLPSLKAILKVFLLPVLLPQAKKLTKPLKLAMISTTPF